MVGGELHFYAPQISACNNERMVKIGAELPKLSPNKTGYPFFWTTLYDLSKWQLALEDRK